MGFPLPILLPLLAGMVYVLAALFLRRAADLGAGVWETARLCNYTTAVVFMPLAWLGGRIPGWHLVWQPALVALLFIAGQVFTLFALKRGDVSVATPVLGVKILLVALLTAVLLQVRVGGGLWLAAALSSSAIVLLSFTRAHPHHRVGSTIALAGSAAGSYALFDVLVQKWSPYWGAGRFLPAMAGCVAGASVFLRAPGRAASARSRGMDARFWVVGGAACLALQGLLIVSSIAVYGQATVANVLYSSRGLWSVVGVWLIGHWFSNPERHHGPRVLFLRLAGAVLMMAAILLVVLEQDRQAARLRTDRPLHVRNPSAKTPPLCGISHAALQDWL